MRRMRGLVALLASGLAISACGGASVDGARATTEPVDTPVAMDPGAALVQFSECDAFLDHVIDHAVDLVGPYGLEGLDFWPWARSGMFFDESAMAAEQAAPTAGGGSDFSNTNVQVEGIDEPDLVKGDGERIVVLSNGSLIVVDVTGDEPIETGRLALQDTSVQSLFLSGDTALLFGSLWSSHPIPLAERDAIAPVQSTPTMRILEVDLTGEPEIVRTMEVDGSLVSGRMIGDTVRLVSTSMPVGFEWSYPKGSGLRAEREATEENREIIRNSTAENWLPYYVVTDAQGEVVSEGTLLECDRAAHPEEFSGLDMLSVTTIDLSDGLEISDATGVLARGDTTYASSQNLYVATQDWDSWRWLQTGAEEDRPEGPVTEIHKFDISTSTVTYQASGSVEGYLLNQFAMDEHHGVLRVASTTTPGWWGSGPEPESRVTMLWEAAGDLVEIGMVDGLGETEQIYSVRFMGEVGYVVTFRQTDPLYTLDLSDPRAPAVVGELKVPGYSAYLHPLGADLLLGVGQDAADNGQVLGTQVSVFDVSDPSSPERVDTYTLSEGSNSQVEYDHHAFLYWGDLAVIPVQQWWWDGKEETGFSGAVGLRVGSDGQLREIDRVVHPGGDGKSSDYQDQILRTMVVGDSVYTISPKGIMKSALETLDEEAWLDF
ncbi:MAG TPA: beta-propeller domain-containing protein [Acidimicrobiia bacterium]|nr:beta-propeller domain-containing protein [Acidimicrobiia bacterium]